VCRQGAPWSTWLVLGVALSLGIGVAGGAADETVTGALTVGEQPDDDVGAESPEPPSPGEVVGRILLILALLTGQALVAASETSFLAVGRVKAREFAEQGRAGRVLVWLLNRSTRVLTTLLLCITTLLTFADGQVTLLFETWLGETLWVIVLVPVVMALVAIPFAELLPILYAARTAERLSLQAAIPVRVLCTGLFPVVWVLEGLASLVLRLLGGRPEPPVVRKDDIEVAIEAGREGGALPADQGQMLRSVFEFVDTVAKEAMTPRTDVTFLRADMTVREALEEISQDFHSRFPVYQDTRDKIIGVIHAKDLLPFIGPAGESQTLAAVLAAKEARPVFLTPETKPISDLLHEMQRQKVSLAVVVDEHGGVEGIITIEDILEELVGDIFDEEDREEWELSPVEGEPQTFLCHGRLSIDKLNRELDVSVPSEGYETVAGFLLTQLGHVPAEGETLQYANLHWTVVKVDAERRRIHQVRVTKQEPEAGEPADPLLDWGRGE